MSAVFVWPSHKDPEKCSVWGPFESVEMAFTWAADEGLANGFAVEIRAPDINADDIARMRRSAASLRQALDDAKARK